MAMPQGGGFWQMAQGHSSQALNAYRGQTPKQETEVIPPGKTAGGGMMATAGGAMAGYSALGTTSIGPGYGTLIGAGVGLLAYLLS